MQYKNFNKYIREERNKQKHSLNNFAIICGIDSASLSRFETGKSDILFGNFLKIANGLKKTPAKLLTDFEIWSKQNH